MAERDRPHLVVSGGGVSEPFTLDSRGGDSAGVAFSGDRRAHGRRLKRELEEALSSAEDDVERIGTYVAFVSFPGLELALTSLDPRARGEQPELVSVREERGAQGVVQVATVYIPDGRKGYFLDRLARYVESAAADKAKHAALVEGIQAIRRATIRELWTDPAEQFPSDLATPIWWEVWLRKRDGEERARFATFAATHDLGTSEHYLGFADRTVVLLHATANQLAELFDSIDDLAELRRPHDVSNLLTGLPASEQAEWVSELRKRVKAAGADSPVVCILDTGVQGGHPLLNDSLSASDAHVADGRWQVDPVNGHGTEMAGLALFGDLQAAIASSLSIPLQHRLESVKVLPDSGNNQRDLYGGLTARAVDRPEIQAGRRLRVFMLAVTAPTPGALSVGGVDGQSNEAGRPTSWSAAIDALAFGRAIDDTDPRLTYLDRDEERRPRLFVISAGNIRDLDASDDHLERSDLEPVEDPAQSWNAITVGAYSATDNMAGAPAAFAGYVPIAPRGELAPVSRTSVVFDRRKWPFKPDVVADGGNVAASPDRTGVDTPENLALLTTRLQRPGEGFFTTTRDTSAATAQVAALAADIMAAYPGFRPETVRALVVHSAEWTSAMRTHIETATNKTQLASILRRYGMGVPDRSRAMRSAADALTLISEAQLHPYEREGNATDGKTREMNLHELPWPKDELEALGDTQVGLRVTLSYFIEPNPSSRGWSGRYVYPSHGLRFAMRRPEDSVDSFRRRINARARIDGNRPPKLETEDGWLFGASQQQAAGSLHTDIWTGSAVDLASKGSIAVYPVAGWWKNGRGYDQSDEGVDYSLVVSIEAPNVDLWTAVAQQISPTVVVET